MNAHPFVSTAAYVSLGALVLWRLYARVRRLVGRQRLSKRRPLVTLVVFPLLLVVVALPSLAHPNRLLWLAGAVACGAALGVVGLRRTRFEAVAGQGLFYTPDPYLGVGLSLLFAARVAYRLVEVLLVAPPGARVGAADFAQSPLTLAAFGLLAGYYIAYALGLVRWRARATSPSASSQAGDRTRA